LASKLWAQLAQLATQRGSQIAAMASTLQQTESAASLIPPLEKAAGSEYGNSFLRRGAQLQFKLKSASYLSRRPITHTKYFFFNILDQPNMPTKKGRVSQR
jgi:hypothetical protein